MKRVLIVGSTSAVGLACGRLLAETCEVLYAGRRESDFPIHLPDIDFRLFEGMRFDIVVHVVADFGGKDDEDYSRAEQVNAVGTLNVCRLARQVQSQHLVIVSSLFANYEPGQPYYGIYSLSKRHGDELAQLYCADHAIPLSVLRPTCLYDADSRCRAHQPLFYLTLDKAEQGEDIVFYGNNDARRNYLFLDDFCAILGRVIQGGVTGVFNCPAPANVRLSEIAETAYSVFGRRGRVRFLTDKPDIPDIPVVADNRLYEKIGFRPPTDLAGGIQKIKDMRESVSK
jgi:nucleoside-diphosphate-sugar epimerase